jgi:hypothetical protein
MLTSVGAVTTENEHDLVYIIVAQDPRERTDGTLGLLGVIVATLNNDSWDGILSTSLTIPGAVRLVSPARIAAFLPKQCHPLPQEGHSPVPAIRLSVLVAHPRGPEMRELVSLPLLCLDLEFRPMIARLDGRYICGSCGHTAYPADMRYLSLLQMLRIGGCPNRLLNSN